MLAVFRGMPPVTAVHLTLMAVLWLHKATASNVTTWQQLRFHDFEPRQLHPNPQPSFGIDRQSRGFHFEANTHDLTIEIEFVVPLVHVPLGLGRSLTQSSLRNLLDLNVNGLVRAGTIVVIGGIIALLLKVLSSSLALAPVFVGAKSGRDDGSPSIFGQFVERKLHEQNINVPVCLKRTVCDLVRSSHGALTHGEPSSMDAIVVALSTMDYLHESARGTALQEAVQWGRLNSTSCPSVYHQCNWPSTEHKAFRFLMDYGKQLLKRL